MAAEEADEGGVELRREGVRWRERFEVRSGDGVRRGRRRDRDNMAEDVWVMKCEDRMDATVGL